MTEKESQNRNSYMAFGTIPRNVLEEASRAFTYFSLYFRTVDGNKQRKKTNTESYGLQMYTGYDSYFIIIN